MENILIFDKVAGYGIDIDVLDDGRIIIDKITAEDF